MSFTKRAERAIANGFAVSALLEIIEDADREVASIRAASNGHVKQEQAPVIVRVDDEKSRLLSEISKLKGDLSEANSRISRQLSIMDKFKQREEELLLQAKDAEGFPRYVISSKFRNSRILRNLMRGTLEWHLSHMEKTFNEIFKANKDPRRITHAGQIAAIAHAGFYMPKFIDAVAGEKTDSNQSIYSNQLDGIGVVLEEGGGI